MGDLIAAAREVKKESSGAVAGAVFRGIRSDTLIDTITGFVNNSVGASDRSAPCNIRFDGDWSNPRMDDADIVRGFSTYPELMKAGPMNIQAMDWPDAPQFFMAGGAAFFVDASLFAPGFENAANAEADWLFIQYKSNSENATATGKLHGGAPRLSTREDSEYASCFPQGYVDAVAAAMPNSQTSVVQRAVWNPFALRIVDVMQPIHGGAYPTEAGASAQADFQKMAAN